MRRQASRTAEAADEGQARRFRNKFDERTRLVAKRVRPLHPGITSERQT